MNEKLFGFYIFNKVFFCWFQHFLFHRPTFLTSLCVYPKWKNEKTHKKVARTHKNSVVIAGKRVCFLGYIEFYGFFLFSAFFGIWKKYYIFFDIQKIA